MATRRHRSKNICSPSKDASGASPQPTSGRLHRSRRVILLAALLLIICGGIIAVWTWHRRPQPLLPSLQTQGLDPMVVAAVEESQEAVRNAPHSGAAWGRLGQILYVHGLDRPAIDCFARAAQLAPDDPRWTYLHGRAIKRENGDASLSLLRRAADLCRGNPPAPSLLLAELLLERGDLTQAQAQIDLVLRRDGADPRALLDRARLQIALGKWQEALRDLEESIRRAPNVKVSHLLLASVYARAGDTAAAQREATRARTLPEQPDWPDPFLQELSDLAIGRSALLQRAQQLLAQGHSKQAIVALEAAASQYGDHAEVLIALGDAYLRDGQPARAQQALQRAIAVEPQSSEAQLRLGQALAAQQRFTDALTPLREAARVNPNLPRTHYELGICLQRLGDLPGAIDHFRQTIRVEPSFKEGYIALAQALNEAGRREESIEPLQRALALDPDDQTIQDLLKRAQTVPANH
jgi:tetratricopeptide (TPR) repeat protein